MKVTFKALSIIFSSLLLNTNSYANFKGVQIPAGTILKVRTSEPIHTLSRPIGYEFTASIDKAININDKKVIKAETKVIGKVIDKTIANKKTGGAEIVVTLTSIYDGNKKVIISTYSQAGLGDALYPQEKQNAYKKEGFIKDNDGNLIGATIPVTEKGNYLIINEYTPIYFTVKKDFYY